MVSNIAAHIPVLSETLFHGSDGLECALVDVIRDNNPDEASESVEARLEAEYHRGLDEGRQAAGREAAGELADLKALHANQMEELKSSLGEAVSAQLADDLKFAFDDLEDRITASLANLLRPLLKEQILHKVLASFEQSLRDLWDGKQVVVVQGPSDLIGRVRQRFEVSGLTASFEVADRPELKVTLGDTVIESQLSKWVAALPNTHGDVSDAG